MRSRDVPAFLACNSAGRSGITASKCVCVLGCLNARGGALDYYVVVVAVGQGLAYMWERVEHCNWCDTLTFGLVLKSGETTR